MYSPDFRRALKQRWQVVVVGLLVTLAACAAVIRLVPPKYEAKASVLLLPSSATLGKDGNPYLALDGLQTTADVLSRAMTDSTAVESIKQSGATGTYTVDTDRTTSGPIVLVTADGSTSATVVSTLKTVVDRLPVTLAQLQSSTGVPSTALIRSVVLTQDEVAAATRKTQRRALLAVAVAGIAVTLLVAALIDGLWAKRRRRGLVSGAGDSDWVSETAAVAERDQLVTQDRNRPLANGRRYRYVDEAGQRS